MRRTVAPILRAVGGSGITEEGVYFLTRFYRNPNDQTFTETLLAHWSSSPLWVSVMLQPNTFSHGNPASVHAGLANLPGSVWVCEDQHQSAPPRLTLCKTDERVWSLAWIIHERT